MIRVLIACGALAWATCAAANPLEVIQECAANAPTDSTGIKLLNQRCPGLEPALVALGIDQLLLRGWRERMNVRGLTDVAAMFATYHAPALRAAPDTSLLTNILRGLNKQQLGATRSWWDGLTAWVRDWLAHSDSIVAVWLRRLFEGTSLSPNILKAMSYALTGVLAVVAIVVLVLEVRASRSMRRPTVARKDAPQIAAEAAFLAGLVPAQARDELSDLLRRLVQRLLQTGRLKIERSLTHRELIQHSVLDDDVQRGAFAGVATAAESALYGRQDAASPPSQLIAEQGRWLLEQLHVPPTAT